MLSCENIEDKLEKFDDYKLVGAKLVFCFVLFAKLFMYTSKDDDKLNFIVCLRPGGGEIPQAVGLRGQDFGAHNNMRRADRGSTCWFKIEDLDTANTLWSLVQV